MEDPVGSLQGRMKGIGAASSGMLIWISGQVNLHHRCGQRQSARMISLWGLPQVRSAMIPAGAMTSSILGHTPGSAPQGATSNTHHSGLCNGRCRWEKMAGPAQPKSGEQLAEGKGSGSNTIQMPQMPWEMGSRPRPRQVLVFSVSFEDRVRVLWEQRAMHRWENGKERSW